MGRLNIASIRGSVGDPKQGATNNRSDTATVRGLLNIQIVENRQSDRLLEINRGADSSLVKAIIEFQRRRNLAQTGFVAPGDLTCKALLDFRSVGSMRVSQSLIEWLENQGEGFRPLPYNDNARPSIATIGFGHKLHKGPVTMADLEDYKNGITRQQAEVILQRDLSDAEQELQRNVNVPLTQNQFDALTSLTFNIGPDAFAHSTLLLNDGDYLGANEEFVRWRFSHHRAVPGLYERRLYEAKLFSRR